MIWRIFRIILFTSVSIEYVFVNYFFASICLFFAQNNRGFRLVLFDFFHFSLEASSQERKFLSVRLVLSDNFDFVDVW